MKVSISPTPSRASQLRVLTETLAVALKGTPKAYRVPPAQCWMLLVVSRMEAEREDATVTELQARLQKSQAATSRLIAACAEAGTLAAEVHAEDGRKTVCRLTAAGRRYVDDVLDAMRDAVVTERTKQSLE